MRVREYILPGLILAFLLVFLVWPLVYVFRNAVVDTQGPTLLYLRMMVTDPAQLEAIGTSFLIATLVTLCSLCMAMPVAWLIARRSFRGRSILSWAILIPMILPPFVGAVGVKILFARFGAFSTLMMWLGITDGPVDWLGAYPLGGVVIMESLHLFPVLYLNLVAAFSNIDPSLEDAAANLGCSPWGVFRRVAMPLAGPGLFAGTILVFIWSFTELGTPLVFGFRRILPVMVYDKVSEAGTNPLGYAQVVLLLLVAGVGFWMSKRMAKSRGGVATLGRMSVTRQEAPLTGFGALLAQVGIGMLLLAAILPHISVVLVSISRTWLSSVIPQGLTLEFYARAIGSELTRTALSNSLLLAVGATVLDVIIGFALAWLCVRKRIIGSDWLDTLSMVPLAVPGIVIAFGYLGCFTGGWFKDSLLDPRFNPMVILAISYAIRRMPYMVRAAHAGMEQTSRVYEEAASNLGATPFRVIRRITLPLIAANLLAGGILCFAFSMLEVSDSLILAQRENFYPITKAIYVLMEQLENGTNVAAALGVWAMALLAAAMLWASSLLGKRMGQMFRAG
ncbi:MAG: iron ABC transporter permease [bacterium]